MDRGRREKKGAKVEEKEGEKDRKEVKFWWELLRESFLIKIEEFLFSRILVFIWVCLLLNKVINKFFLYFYLIM